MTLGFSILPHRSLYLVQFCLAIFRGPVILISMTVVKHGRTMIHLEKYRGCISGSRNAPTDSDLSPPPFLGRDALTNAHNRSRLPEVFISLFQCRSRLKERVFVLIAKCISPLCKMYLSKWAEKVKVCPGGLKPGWDQRRSWTKVTAAPFVSAVTFCRRTGDGRNYRGR